MTLFQKIVLLRAPVLAITVAYGGQRKWSRSEVAMCTKILAELTASVRTGMKGNCARYVDELSLEASKAADRGDQSCLYQIGISRDRKARSP